MHTKIDTVDARDPLTVIRASSWVCANDIWRLGDYRVHFDAATSAWVVNFKDQLVAKMAGQASAREAHRRVEQLIESSTVWQNVDPNRSWYLRDYAVCWNPGARKWAIYHFGTELIEGTYGTLEHAKLEVERRVANKPPDSSLDAKEKELADLHRREWHCDNAIWHIFDYEVRPHGNTGWAIYHKHALLENHANYATPTLAMQATDYLIAASTWGFDGRRWCKGHYTLRWCERPKAIRSGWYIYYREKALDDSMPFKNPEIAKLEVDQIIRMKDLEPAVVKTPAAESVATKPFARSWRYENSVWKISDYIVRWHHAWAARGRGWYIWYQDAMLPLQAYENADDARAAVEVLMTQAYDELLSSLFAKKATNPDWHYDEGDWLLGDYRVVRSGGEDSKVWMIFYKALHIASLESAELAKYEVERRMASLMNQPPAATPCDTHKTEPMNSKFNNIWELIAASIRTRRPVEILEVGGTWEICSEFSPANLRPMLNTDWLSRVFISNKLRLKPVMVQKTCWHVMCYLDGSLSDVSGPLPSHDAAANWIIAAITMPYRHGHHIVKIDAAVPADESGQVVDPSVVDNV